jgi:hypothetical protein
MRVKYASGLNAQSVTAVTFICESRASNPTPAKRCWRVEGGRTCQRTGEMKYNGAVFEVKKEIPS